MSRLMTIALLLLGVASVLQTGYALKCYVDVDEVDQEHDCADFAFFIGEEGPFKCAINHLEDGGVKSVCTQATQCEDPDVDCCDGDLCNDGIVIDPTDSGIDIDPKNSGIAINSNKTLFSCIIAMSIVMAMLW